LKRLEETHGPVFELTRHFLARMFDSELFAGRDRWRPVAIGAFILLLHTAVLLPKAARYQRLSRLPAPDLFRAPLLADEAGQITLFLGIAGLLAMLQWQMLLPSRRDYMALASLPIRPRQIFLARFAAFLVFATGVVAALNVPLGLMAPSRGAASALACIFALFRARWQTCCPRNCTRAFRRTCRECLRPHSSWRRSKAGTSAIRRSRPSRCFRNCHGRRRCGSPGFSRRWPAIGIRFCAPWPGARRWRRVAGGGPRGGGFLFF